MSRRLLALGVIAAGLVLPSTALADIGFNKDALKANVQASIQSATVVQTGVATSGPATANGGVAIGGKGEGGDGGYVNTGNDGTSQSQSATSSTGAASSGSISGANTSSIGNDGGSISNDNATKSIVDNGNKAESDVDQDANGGFSAATNANHEGDNTSAGGGAANLCGVKADRKSVV